MTDLFTAVTRRSALARMGVAGLGLLAMQSSHAEVGKTDALRQALESFSESSRERLRDLLRAPGFSGHIPAQDVATLAAAEHQNVETLMVDLLPLARTYARPP